MKSRLQLIFVFLMCCVSPTVWGQDTSVVTAAERVFYKAEGAYKKIKETGDKPDTLLKYMPDDEVRPYYRVVYDYDHDGLKDTIYYTAIDQDPLIVWLVDGNGPLYYTIDLQPSSLSNMIYTQPVPISWLKGTKTRFTDAVTHVLQKRSRFSNPDPSLIFLMDASGSLIYTGNNPVYNKGFHFSGDWFDKSLLLHNDDDRANQRLSYITMLHGDSFAALAGLQYVQEKDVAVRHITELESVDGDEIPYRDYYDTSTARGWVLYTTWCHWICLHAMPKGKVHTTNIKDYFINDTLQTPDSARIIYGCHSIYLQKGNRLRCIFETGINTMQRPEKLRWASIGSIIMFHDLLIFRYLCGSEEARLMVIDISRNKAGMLKTVGNDDAYIGSAIIKKDKLILKSANALDGKEFIYNYADLKKNLEGF